MPQQDLNNTFAHKLDGLQALPGEAPFNKNAAWEKLEARVNKKRSSKKALWYWAAASIAVVCIAPLLLSKNNTGSTIPALVKENVVVPAATPQQSKETTFISAEPALVKEVAPSVNTTPLLPAHKILQPGKVADTFIAVVTEKKELLTVAAVPLPDTALAAQTLVAKQKRPVVHLNELEEEDRITSENIAKIKSVKKDRRKNADKSEYATGTINFRIHLKN